MHVTTPDGDTDVPVIRLKRDRFLACGEAHGIRSQLAFARALHIDRQSIIRVLNGTTLPGQRFIAASLAAFPDAAFEDLFELERVA